VANQERLAGTKLLLIGSKAFRAARLPAEIASKIDEATARNMIIVVGEALGACRLYQDCLQSKGYRNVIVGQAKSMRYNVGNWKTMQYGIDLKERESGMIEDCDSAIIIWTDNSGVIAENLELLKNLGKPAFLCEHSTRTNTTEVGWLDPKRTYYPYYHLKEYFRKKKPQNKQFVSYNGGLRRVV
jgi:hypothetical protein